MEQVWLWLRTRAPWLRRMVHSPALRPMVAITLAHRQESARVVTGTSGGLTLTVPTRYAERYLAGQYEPLATDFMRQRLRPGMTAVDVGAHVGYLSCYMSKLVGPAGRVVAIEPAEENARLVRRNAADNDLTIEVICAGAGSRQTTRSLHVTGSSDSHGFYEHPNSRTRRQVTVEEVPLDELFASSPDLVKIDVEGAEVEVLEGMQRMLSEARPDLLVEWAPRCQSRAGREPDELVRLLLDYDYSIRALDDKNGRVLSIEEAVRCAEHDDDWYANLACVHRTRGL